VTLEGGRHDDASDHPRKTVPGIGVSDGEQAPAEASKYTGWSKKTDTQFYFWDNFGNSAPILTILSLLQAVIYGA